MAVDEDQHGYWGDWVDETDYYEKGVEDGIEIGEHRVLSRLRARVEYAEHAQSNALRRVRMNPEDTFEQGVLEGLTTIVTWAKLTLNDIALEHNMRWVPKMDGGYYKKVSDEDLGYTTSAEV